MTLPLSSYGGSSFVFLFEETLRTFGSARLRVQGSSMLPAFRPGDDVLVRWSDQDDAEAGDVIAFNREGRLFVHRVTGRDASGRIITRGDALPAADAPISEGEYLGKVAEVCRAGETITLRTSLLQRATAALFRRSQPCAALFVKLACL